MNLGISKRLSTFVDMSKKGKILVAMSGGIDSTVTAMMLHEEGYEVIGITMKTWDYAQSGTDKKETGCCSLDSINDAREVAVHMGFHHFIVDIREDFGNYVIDNFIEEYMAGRTPNPCVLCNTHIKWDALLKKADALDCEFIATGHYAIKNYNKELDRHYVSKAADRHKDQSYVLWGLEQEGLARSLFPLGPYQKSEVRQLAYDWGHEELSKKGESYEICFVPDNDYRSFLKQNVSGLADKVRGGNYLDKNGKIIGTHNGYPFYTIGQRRGLGIALGEPMYVTEIRPQTNEVVLGRVEELIRNQMQVYKLNMGKYKNISDGMEANVMIRYNDPGTLGLLTNNEDKINVEFLANAKGVAPGQSAVFYEGDDVIAGGIIYDTR